MRYEGCQRQHFRKWGEYLDMEMYGMLRSEFDTLTENGSGNG